MMGLEQQQMNNYTDINPYQLIYCNMNLKIHQHTSKETAENVVRQIGYLHNAIGYVFKDLVKILAFKFPENTVSNIQVPNKPVPSMVRPQMANKQAMDIQFPSQQDVRQPDTKPLKVKQRVNLQEKDKALPAALYGSLIEQGSNLNRQQKPPNTNIFDQYAYSKEVLPEPPKPKEVSTIQLGVQRIIEGVKKKKGVEGKEKEKSGKQPALELKRINSGDHSLSERTEKKNSISEGNPLNHFIDRPIDTSKEADIFSQFIYKNKASPVSKPAPQLQSAQTNMERGQEDESRLWQFLKQKEEPPIYEISDDED